MAVVVGSNSVIYGTTNTGVNFPANNQIEIDILGTQTALIGPSSIQVTSDQVTLDGHFTISTIEPLPPVDGNILLDSRTENNILLNKDDGNFQPGTTVRGRLSNRTAQPLYYNGYCDIEPSTTSSLGLTGSTILTQTQGFNPSTDNLKQGFINNKTVITETEYAPFRAKEFGAGGVGRIGFCYLTLGGDIVFRLHHEGGTYGVVGTNALTFADPGVAVQEVIAGPVNDLARVEYTNTDYALGAASDYQGSTQKETNSRILGKNLKVVGNIESKSLTSGFFVMTENGYVWATTNHNSYGWLNQGNTTNIQETVIVWDIYSYDSQDRYATGGTKPKKVVNITTTHDHSDDPDNTGGVVYLKVLQETDGYHEMWTTGGYNAAGQLADGSVTARSFAKACLFDTIEDPTSSYGGTYVQSSDGVTVNTAGTVIRLTFSQEPNLYLGEFIYIDFTSGTSVDDSYEVVAKNGTGVYTVVRHTGKGARATTSLNTSGTFMVYGRSQLLRKLNRTIIGQWSGGGNAGFCFIQDSTNRIWVVGEASSGIHGTGNTTDKKFFNEISTGESLPLQEIYKMIPGGTDAGFSDAFILFKNWTLWHAGRNTSGYGYGNTTQKLNWTQIAGPGTTLSPAPTGEVRNFWFRKKSSGGAAIADTLYVIDYTSANGWCLWCVGENGNYQLANGVTTDSTTWTIPTKFPQNYGTAASPIRTKTGWIPERIWTGQQTASGGTNFFAMFRNLTTNEYRLYAWGYNASGLLGDGSVTTPTAPIRLTLDVPTYKIKDIAVYCRDTSYDGIGLIMTQDGDIYGIGGGRYFDGAAYLGSPFWANLPIGSGYKFIRKWFRVQPIQMY